jgi:putative transposase
MSNCSRGHGVEGAFDDVAVLVALGVETTNAIESLNYQLRKIIKNRGHFPGDDAVIKLLWLAICNIEDKRARERQRERGKPANERKASGRLVEGQITTN